MCAHVKQCINLRVSVRQINWVQCTDQKLISFYVSLCVWLNVLHHIRVAAGPVQIPGFVCDVCGLYVLGVSAGHVRDDPGRSCGSLVRPRPEPLHTAHA